MTNEEDVLDTLMHERDRLAVELKAAVADALEHKRKRIRCIQMRSREIDAHVKKRAALMAELAEAKANRWGDAIWYRELLALESAVNGTCEGALCTADALVFARTRLADAIRLERELTEAKGLIEQLLQVKTHLPKHLVSTVFIPVLGTWETMVFEASDGDVTDWSEVDCRRYATRAESVVGHFEVVSQWKKR